MTPADDASAAPAAAPAAVDPVAVFDFPQFAEGVTHSLNVGTIPAEIRLEFLKTQVRAYISNRLNSAHTRHEKDADVMAWKAYEAATAADPLQTTVPKPDKAKPADVDYQAVYDRAVADLQAGNVRRVGSGEPVAKKVKDPLISTITDAVVREVYNARHADDKAYTYLKAKADVGPDGVAYLNKMIDAKVAAVAEGEQAALRLALETMRDERYIKPARAMLGLDVSKKVGTLPSIL